MARLSLIVMPGYPCDVTQRGVRSMDVFHSDGDRREYLVMHGKEIVRYGRGGPRAMEPLQQPLRG